MYIFSPSPEFEPWSPRTKISVLPMRYANRYANFFIFSSLVFTLCFFFPFSYLYICVFSLYFLFTPTINHFAFSLSLPSIFVISLIFLSPSLLFPSQYLPFCCLWPSVLSHKHILFLSLTLTLFIFPCVFLCWFVS